MLFYSIVNSNLLWFEKKNMVIIMRLINNRILENLNGLINTNLEVQSGYKNAADKLNDKNLKEIFVIYIQRITEDINELKRLERDLSGGKNIVDHQLKKIPFPLDEADEISILRKCEKLEEKSIKGYETILNEEIPSNLKDIFLKQYNGLRDTRFNMRSLEDQY